MRCDRLHLLYHTQLQRDSLELLLDGPATRALDWCSLFPTSAFDRSLRNHLRELQLLYKYRELSCVVNIEGYFVEVAQGMGVTAQRITDPADFRPALKAAIANTDGPNLIEVVVDGTV